MKLPSNLPSKLPSTTEVKASFTGAKQHVSKNLTSALNALNTKKGKAATLSATLLGLTLAVKTEKAPYSKEIKSAFNSLKACFTNMPSFGGIFGSSSDPDNN